MSLVLQSSGGGSVTLQEPTTASNYTITVPASTATMAIDGPAFSARQSVSQTGITTGTFTKITFTTVDFDTDSDFASSTFTPSVAGYYQVNASVTWNTGVNNTNIVTSIYKNGSAFRNGYGVNTTAGNGASVSSVVYCNGTTDYIEIYAQQSSGSSLATFAAVATNFSACLVRGA
jgi:hypothetical protein